MSERSDYDRLRADVLALRYALVSQHGYSVSDARRLLDDLIEKHPAREVSAADERDLCMESRECRCSACMEERRIAAKNDEAASKAELYESMRRLWLRIDALNNHQGTT